MQLAVVVIGLISLNAQFGSVTFSGSSMAGATKAGAIAAAAMPMVGGYLLYIFAPVLSRNIALSCEPQQ